MINQILVTIKDILKNNTALLFLLTLLGIVLCISAASGKLLWSINGEIIVIEGPWRIILFMIGMFLFVCFVLPLYELIKEREKPLCHTCYGLHKDTIEIDYRNIGYLGEIYQNFELTPIGRGRENHCCYVQYLWADPGIGDEDGRGYIKCHHYEEQDDNFLKVEFQNTKMEYSNVAIRPLDKPANHFSAFEIEGIENCKIVIIARISPEACEDDKYSKKIDISLRLVNGYHEHVEAYSIAGVAGVPNQIAATIQPNQVDRKNQWDVLEFDFFNEKKYDLRVFPVDGNIHRLGAGNKVPTKDMSIISSMVLTFIIKEEQFPENFLGSVDIKQIRIVNRDRFDSNILRQLFNQ